MGGVLAHAQTRADEVTVVAPLNAETTVEGAAFVELRADGQAEDLTGPVGADAAVDALARARTELETAETAETVADVEAELRTTVDAVRSAVVADVLELLFDFPQRVREAVRGELEAAFAEADLAARLEGEASAEARADVLADYRADVRAAAAAVAAAMPDEVSIDTDAMVSLLIAANALAAIS